MESTTPLGGVFLIKRNRFIKNQYWTGVRKTVKNNLTILWHLSGGVGKQ